MSEKERVTEELIAKVMQPLGRVVEENIPDDRGFCLLVFGHQARPWERLLHYVYSNGLEPEIVANILDELSRTLRGGGAKRTGIEPEDLN